MRRADREVKSAEEIRAILALCKTCHVAMVDEGIPYVVPLSFGYELQDGELTLFFHSAKEGRKMDIWRRNRTVCFAISCEGEPIFSAQTPCNSGYYFSSVIGTGEVEFLPDGTEKCEALTRLMKHQTGMEIAFSEEQAKAVCVYRVVSKDFTGKRKPRLVE